VLLLSFESNADDSVTYLTMDYALQRLENGTRWTWLLKDLDAAAESRQIFGGVPKTTTVVASKASIEAIWKLYATALEGKTYICAGLSGSGKTTAALYLLHGSLDSSMRPKRAIMLRESDSKNIALSFCRNRFGADAAAPALHTLLVRALIPPDQREPVAAPRNVNEALELAKSFFLSRKCSAISFETELVKISNAEEMGSSRVRDDCSKLPLLIIDGLAPSEANREFVSSLYEVAFEAKVTVLIFVKDTNWADELCQINGGRHVVPVDQVINNPRGDDVGRRFTEKPQWNMMGWRLIDLQHFATMANIDDVELRDGMTPGEILDIHKQNALGTETPFAYNNTVG
jgi:hypothetical protein